MIPYDFSDYIDIQLLKDKPPDEVADFFKYIDIENFEINISGESGDIEKEVKQWRKFYTNRLSGKKDYTDRDFEPLFSSGDVADFIRNKLGIFDADFNLLDITSEDALQTLLKNALSRQINIISKFTNRTDVLREVTVLHQLIQSNLTNVTSRRLLEGKFTNLVLNLENAFSIEKMKKTILESLPKYVLDLFKNEKKDKIVDFIFNQLTDYDLRALPDYPEFSGLWNRFRARWREFLRSGVFNVNRPLKPTDVFDVVLDVYKNMKKELIDTRNIFKIRFNGLLSRAINKRLSAFNFNAKLRELVRGYGRSAFRNGIQFVGLDPKDFHVLENYLVSKMNNYVRFYVTNLTTKVFSGAVSMAQALIKGDSWANKFINKLFEYGRLAADRNGLYEWRYGKTENHCLSCAYANGQRHFLRFWHKSGILPQSNGHKELYCHGYYCDCSLVRVTGKSRGRLDRIPTL